MRVQMQDIYKSYGAVEVIKGLNLAIAPGEFLVLLGQSGCGKSTALRMIAGLETITSGRLMIGERDVTDVLPKYRDVAMVFQSYALYPHKTVAGNIGYPLKLRKTPKDELDRAVLDAARKVHLEDYLDRYPRQLSGGQRQRVALARAMVRKPSVFLMDEPLSNLDAKLRGVMRAELKRLQADLGVTTVYVTHDQIEAMTMAQKIVVMQDGVIEQTGSPLELYDYPRNVFVAGFIGAPAMNMIRGTVRGGETGVVEANGCALEVRTAGGAEDGQPVVYGIRPEHLELSDQGFPAQVSVVEPTGAETLVFLRFGESELIATFRDRHDFEPGQTVTLRPHPDKAHLFDAASGERL